MILPCRNAEDSLAPCLDSLLAQTYGDFEIILFDDGSEDSTPAIATSYADRDRRVQIVSSEHVGIVAALERACAVARAPILARMDADDVALPTRFSKQLDYLSQHPGVALCGTQVESIGEPRGPGGARYDTWVNGLVSDEQIVRELFVECPLPHPTFMMRREAFEEIGGYRDFGWAEDYDLVMRMRLAGYRFGKVAEPLVQWRHSPGRLSLVDERYSLAQFRALKRHYLFETYLSSEKPFYQWGAGEVGKRWLREWAGARPLAVVDINPRKIGRSIHETPVIPPGDLPPPGTGFVVVAVGAPGARDEIRSWLNARNYAELDDFLFIS